MASTFTAGDATLDIVPSMKGFHRKLATELKAINPTLDVVADTKQYTREVARVANQPRTAVIKVEVARAALAKAEAEIAKAEQHLTSSRGDSEVAAKKVQIAEQQLDETRSKAGVKTSQISSSELKVAQARRTAASAVNDVRNAEARLLATRSERSDRQRDLFNVGQIQDAQKSVSTLGNLVAGLGAAFGEAGVSGANGIGKLAGEASSAAGPVGALVATGLGITLIGGAASFASAGLIGLAQTAITAAGAVGLIPGALASGGAVAATAYIGFSGVTDAIDAMGKAEQSAGKDAQNYAKQQRAANDQIVSAQLALSRAREDSATSQAQAIARVADAERQLARTTVEARRAVVAADKQALAAQQGLEHAQRALQDAIEDTTRAQRDLNFQVQGGVLDAETATLDLAVAQEQYNAAVEANVSGDELKRYEIALRRAKLQVDATAASNDDLSKQQAEVQKSGVRGARAVTDATEQVQAAAVALADAQDAAAYQRVQSEQQVADAVQNVTDAQDAQKQAALQASRQIADAQRALDSAYTSARETLTEMSTSAQAVNDALAALSPNARAFVEEVNKLRPAWNEVKNSIQDALFNGLDDKLEKLTGVYFPIMKTRLSEIADEANNAAGELVDMLTDPKNAGSVDKILEDTRDIVRELGKAMVPFVEAFLDIAEVGTDVLSDIAGNAGSAAEAFRDWIHQMKESGKLKEWMTGAVDVIKDIIVGVVGFGQAIISMVEQLNRGVKDSGFYDQISTMFHDFLDFVQSEEGKKFMYDLGRTIGDVATWVAKIIEFVAKLMKIWDDIDQFFRDMSDGSTGFLEVVTRVFLGIATLGISEIIIGLFSIDWDALKEDFTTGTGGVLARIALAITTFGLSEVIIAAFSVDWGGLGDWFTEGTGSVLVRVAIAIATFGLSEVLRGAFAVDWGKLFTDLWNGLTGVFSKLAEKIRENPLGNLLLGPKIGGGLGDLTPWSLGGVGGHADGGLITGPGTGTSDSIPALLSNGEFVVNAAATARNRGALEWLNAKRFATGGLVGNQPATGTNAPGQMLTLDVAAVADLGDVAAVVTAALEQLRAEITALVADVIEYWLQLTQATTAAADTITARQTLLQQFYAASWVAMQATAWASVNGQAAAFNALLNGLAAVRTAMTQTADWATGQYGRIRAAAADPIRWVLQQPFNAGLIAAWNQLDTDFSLGKHVNPVPIGFATGGHVRGPGSATSDSIRAMLSDGEFVVKAAITRKALPFLEALNGGQAEALEAAGVGIRGYATGGVVANTGGQYNAAVFRGQDFLRKQAGKPYIWGGVGPEGFDCSGLVSAVANVLRGESNPYRRLGTAATQPWSGFVPGLSSAFATGYNSHHIALTLGGLNGEAQTFGVPVLVGPRAAGADSGQFTGRASLPTVGGQFVPGGGPGADPHAMMVAAFADTLAKIDNVGQMWPGNRAASTGAGVARAGVTALTGFGENALNSLLTVPGAAGSPEVVAAVRAVARAFGWGDGAEWNALSSLISGESSWDPNIHNKTSSAAGLFQKMTSLHGPLESTVAGQTEWGLNYIKGAYGDPIGAYGKWLSRNPHWYDDGGIADGMGFMAKNTIEPERVLSPAMTKSFDRMLAYVGSGAGIGPSGNAGLESLRGLSISGPITVNGLDGYIDGRIEDFDESAGDAIHYGSRT